jgi:hypothetical protein
MSELVGGPGGAMQGKTAGFNYRYSNGKNIVSQYIAKINDAKTAAQLAQRFKISKLAYMFSDVNSKLIRIAYNKKSFSGNGFTNILHELKPVMPLFPENTLQTHTWFRRMWETVVDTLKGYDDDRLDKNNFIINSNVLFDELAINLYKPDGQLKFASIYVLDKTGKLRLMENFSFIKNFGDELTPYLFPWGLYLCWFSEQSDTDPEQDYYSGLCHVNVLDGVLCESFGIPGDIFNVAILEDAYVFKSLHNHFWSPEDVSNYIYLINPRHLNKLPISKICRRYGIDCFKNQHPELGTLPLIDWAWKFNNDFCSLAITEVQGNKVLTLTVDPSKTNYTPTGQEIIQLCITYIDSYFKPYTVFAESAPGALSLEFTPANFVMNYCIKVSYFWKLQNIALSEPITFNISTLPGHRMSSLLWSFYNQNPYRFKYYRDNFNVTFKLLLFYKDRLVPYTYVTVSIDYGDGIYEFIQITGDLGLVNFNITENKQVAHIKLVKAGNTKIITNTSQLTKNNYNYLGTFIIYLA